ncbi:MAG: MarR family transcriptional regulator [Cytophagales bacterium]|nr:MarR family transcriptional regulator [Cytophagales bacterium]
MDYDDRFIEAFETLIFKIQQVDATCQQAYGDVSKREFNLLIMLGKSEKMIVREVADFLGIPVSSATAIIDKLSEKGYLRRIHSSSDRRIIVVVLSQEGKSIYLSLTSKMKNFARGVMDKLGEAEKKKLVQLLEKAAA